MLTVGFAVGVSAQGPLLVQCPPNQTNWICDGTFAIAKYPTPATSGGCAAPATVTCTPPSGSSFALGTTTVRCSATNSCGDSAKCNFLLTLAHDSSPPVFQGPINQTVWLPSTNTAPSPLSNVEYTLTVTDTETGRVRVDCTPPSGSAFPVGVTQVDCSAVDDCNNRSSHSFTVTVKRDVAPPIIECPTNIVVWTASTAGSPPQPTNVDFTIRVTDTQAVGYHLDCNPPSGSAFPVGETLVNCVAIDYAGNRAECSFPVIVRFDNEAPILQCPPDFAAFGCSPNGVPVNYPAPAATDDSGVPPSIVCVPPSGSLFLPGATTVICTATDGLGQQSRCSFEVTVGPDPIAPVILCPPDISVFSCSSTGRLVIFNPPPTVEDNGYEAAAIVCVPPSQSVFPVGTTTTVLCTATDDCGNQSQCSFTVTVTRDLEPPTASCLPDIIVDTCDPRGVPVHWPLIEVEDNYIPYPQNFCTPPSGSVFPVGTTPVTCEVRDSCGNRTKCVFNVTVRVDASLPGTDTDGSGLSDIWEVHFNAEGLAPDDDTDGDGASNLQEARAGTDPRNPASVLGIAIEVPPPSPETPPFYLKLQGVDGDSTDDKHKVLQFQFALRLDDPWRDLGYPVQFKGGVRVAVADLPGITTNPPQVFFRVLARDVDADGDGISAWEESIVGTSDQTARTGWGNDWISGGTGQDGTNSTGSSGGSGRDVLIGGLGGDHGGAGLDILIGNTGGDRQAALDWIASHSGKARLREVALAHLGGSPNGPTRTKLVTATGTGGWLKLSSWTLDIGTHDPVHLQDTEAFEGWNAKLEVLEPPQSPALTLNPFVSGRIGEDENLWLSVRRVDADGKHDGLSTLGYGANASLRVYDYAMAHQAVVGSGIGVESYLLVTPVMGLNTAGQRELRVVTWSIHPNSGAINGVFDTGNLGHTNLPADGGRLQIAREAGGRYVVSYLTRDSQLSSWFFDVNAAGAAFARGGATSGLDIRGDAMDPIGSTDFALGALNSAGFVTLLADANCTARFAVWEDRVVACDPACYARPFFITDSTLDLKPDDLGVVVAAPVVTDAWDDTAKAYSRYGEALATGDFNGDGKADLAIGIPGHDIGKEDAPTAESAGQVFIKYGHIDGLAETYPDRAWSQDSDGVPGVADTGDLFGQALASGDFNGDGFADLAVGAPHEEVDGVAGAGAVNVLFGSASGLRASGSQIWYQGADGLEGTPGEDDWFGFALVSGDFNGDGFADLAIGVPHETVTGFLEAGAVQILHGSAGGLSAAAGLGTQLLHQDSPSTIGAVEEGDHFGLELAAGDLNGDGRTDLVIGIPQEEVEGVHNAGAVQVIYGSANGLGPENQLVYQGNIEPAGGAFPASSEVGDSFGWHVAAGDFNDDGYADLAVGVPHENLENLNLTDAGVVHILRGGASGVTAAGHQLLVQAIPEHGDLMGFALAPGDFNGDGRTDLAVSSINEDVKNNAVTDAGAADIYHGAASGLSWATSFYQGALGNGGYAETAEDFNRFGFALSAGDFNGDGRDDLAVGVPNEDQSRDGGEDNRIDAGAVHAIYGSASGLTGEMDAVFAQGAVYRVRALLADQQREATGIGEGKLFEKMPAGERTNGHVASVTKCMTLLLAAELLQMPGANVDLDDEVVVSGKAAGTGGSIVEPPYGAVLETNDVMPLELLLHGMMLRSCNKSSVAIGEHLARKQYEFLHGALPGGFNATAYFITNMMQGKADQLAMVNTICGHAAGGMITTPQDLVTLWQHAWQFAEFRRIATETIYSDAGEDAEGKPKNWFLQKHGADDYPGLEGWKGGNGGLWEAGVSVPYGVPWCSESVLGQATRLDRSLTFALQQTKDRWTDAPAMLDYGYRALFTPDWRGSGSIITPAVTDFAVRRIHDTLAVSAVIHGTNTLRLDAWQVVAGLGQAGSLNHSTLEVTGLPAGTHAPRVKVFDLTRLPTVGEAEADYLTGRLDGGRLRLDVWRVAAEPGF